MGCAYIVIIKKYDVCIKAMIKVLSRMNRGELTI